MLNGFILVLVFIILMKIYIFDDNNIIYIKSELDEDFHLVQDFQDKDKAANMMAKIKKKIDKLLLHLKKNYPNNNDIKRLLSNYDEDNVRETEIEDDDTSYSIEKGRELHLCLRNKENFKLHKTNILMFVTIHELAHLMSQSYGHNEEFNKNFIFLLKESIKIGIYNNVDYSKKEVNYCGMNVTDNPLF